MKNTTKILTGSILTLALVATGISEASAYQGDPNVEGPNYSPERHETMTAAFASGDYTTWTSIMAENTKHGRVMDKVTADNFGTFVSAHNLALSGDIEGAKELRTKMGLGMKDGSGQGQYGEGKGNGLRDGNGKGRKGGRGMRSEK